MASATSTIVRLQPHSREHVSVLERLQRRRTDRWLAPWTLRDELAYIETLIELIEEGHGLSALAIERLAVSQLRIRVAAECFA